MNYKKLKIRIISIIIVFSFVSTSIPVYAYDFGENAAESVDVWSTLGSDVSVNDENESPMDAQPSEGSIATEAPANEVSIAAGVPANEGSIAAGVPANEGSIAPGVPANAGSIASETPAGEGNVYTSIQVDANNAGSVLPDDVSGTITDEPGQEAQNAPLAENNVSNDATDSLIGGSVQVDTIKAETGVYSGKIDATDATNELTVVLRGLTEENKQKTFDEINSLIKNIMQNPTVTLTSDDFVDAEKYNVNNFTYDANHCWAATAANVLWTTGYAKNAINPQTGTYFASEDEVLAYFSEHFTDEAGSPDEGADWFLNGKYAYKGYEGAAQPKDDESGGLFHIDGLGNKIFMNYLLMDSKGIKNLDRLKSGGMGLLLRWLVDGKLTAGAHWVTIVGAVIDEAASNIIDKYKAVIIANSDDSPANGDLPADYETKLKAKSERPNQYVAYKLNYDDVYGAWYIEGMGSVPAYITYLFALKDYKIPQNNSNGILVQNPENPDELYLITPSGAEENQVMDSMMTKDISCFRALSMEQLEAEENINMLKEYMLKNATPYFSLTDGIVSENEDFTSYIAAPETFVYSVAIDEAELPFDQYVLTSTVNGLCKIIIKNDYLKTLSKGKHTLSIKVQGMDVLSQTLLIN